MSLEAHYERPVDDRRQRIANKRNARRMQLTLQRYEELARRIESREQQAADAVVTAATDRMRRQFAEATGIEPELRHELRAALAEIVETGTANVTETIQALRGGLRYGLASGSGLVEWTSALMTVEG